MQTLKKPLGKHIMYAEANFSYQLLLSYYDIRFHRRNILIFVVMDFRCKK